MEEIFLNGASFANNFGDILFFQIFSDVVKESGKQPTMYSKNELIMNQLPNVKFYNNRRQAITNANKIAYVGGGYLGEQPSSSYIKKLRWGISNIKKVQIFGLLGLIYRKPVGIFGAGGGQVSNPVTKLLIRKIVGIANPVIVRDEQTKREFTGLPNFENIQVSVDTILGIKRIMNDIIPEERPNIILHLTDSPDHDKYSKLIWENVSQFLRENPSYSCTVVTDHFGGGQARSYEYFRELSLRAKNLEAYKHSDNKKLIELISKSEYVITNKLHVGIVGISFNKKVISIPNHPKVSNIFSQLGISNNLIRKTELKEKALFQKMVEIRNESYILDSHVESMAISNLEKFNRFIHGEMI
ncbi:polysaccharide pyruvyl transferase family protein [Enterococcus dispar]|uniref:polysaccharide pyruvyl transferase family protein n=1 Tax=Enterococcus dispar TaxID=44009 RepID=UPI002890EDA4|nr:polysaccharide pyruvyl transferase family protein [Enterococcus dispar]MDT2706161.1 polysaccharide pyruvyl transferase family protein [Enterococcus dispar]